MHRVNHVKHGGVVSHEVDHLIWVVLGGLHVWGERAAGTLVKTRRREKPQWVKQSCLRTFLEQQCLFQKRAF